MMEEILVSKLNYLKNSSIECLMYRRVAMVKHKNSVSTLTKDRVGNMSI
jgi:hypothetical protein